MPFRRSEMERICLEEMVLLPKVAQHTLIAPLYLNIHASLANKCFPGGNDTNLTNTFQMGWNHQRDKPLDEFTHVARSSCQIGWSDLSFSPIHEGFPGIFSDMVFKKHHKRDNEGKSICWKNDIINKRDIKYYCPYKFQAFVYILWAHCQEGNFPDHVFSRGLGSKCEVEIHDPWLMFARVAKILRWFK